MKSSYYGTINPSDYYNYHIKSDKIKYSFLSKVKRLDEDLCSQIYYNLFIKEKENNRFLSNKYQNIIRYGGYNLFIYLVENCNLLGRSNNDHIYLEINYQSSINNFIYQSSRSNGKIFEYFIENNYEFANEIITEMVEEDEFNDDYLNPYLQLYLYKNSYIKFSEGYEIIYYQMLKYEEAQDLYIENHWNIENKYKIMKHNINKLEFLNMIKIKDSEFLQKFTMKLNNNIKSLFEKYQIIIYTFKTLKFFYKQGYIMRYEDLSCLTKYHFSLSKNFCEKYIKLYKKYSKKSDEEYEEDINKIKDFVFFKLNNIKSIHNIRTCIDDRYLHSIFFDKFERIKILFKNIEKLNINIHEAYSYLMREIKILNEEERLELYNILDDQECSESIQKFKTELLSNQF